MFFKPIIIMWWEQKL